MNEQRAESILQVRDIPDQAAVSWAVALSVSWGSLKRRMFRSSITMTGVILAIAFLTYMLVTDDITKALIGADIQELNIMLMKADIDILTAGSADTRMLLLLSLSLLTCLVGIINSMLMSVTERIKEIGTMKCLGALDTFILKIYFIESALMGLIGALLGMLLGLLVAVVVQVHGFGSYVFSEFPGLAMFGSLGTAFLIGLVISVVAAIAPAQWAATKEPVEAMRGEQ